MALPKKKCPKPGTMVTTKAGLVGTTTGNCGKRRSVEVALLGVGTADFKRSELKALTTKQTARLKAELNRATGAVRAPKADLPEAWAHMPSGEAPIRRIRNPYTGQMHGY